MARRLVLEDLIVWKLACEFEEKTLALVSGTNARRDFKFAAQLTDAATGVPSNITEGFHRFRAREFAQFIRYARASLAEAEKRLHTGVQKQYFTQEQIEPLVQLAKRLGKGLMNLHAYLLEHSQRR